MIRLFLVDDHKIIRDGLRSLLEAEPTLEVVGEASNGEELLDQLATTPADLVLLDVNMPTLDGFATATRLHEQYPAVRVLALSMLNDETHVGRMLESGAHGYVLKSAGKLEIFQAIEAVMAGRPYLGAEIGISLLTKALQTPAPPEPAKGGGLSKRELEVLQLIAEGLTNAEIADKLFTSKRTIETHRQNIIEKTQTKNTAALIRYAARSGLLQ
ncbi:response regulator [Hymenobacter chitinivorans]|uniref:DNA-binding NarL/FixJ family response regulator n=1 Tax=Hymenobacter chitinivorans DSM 11115 TaxID=1121954 RepID=A0A2M9ASW3_9BACT|nr:response regulator transcription factor [Hymenobacter chitinivorans]PJJ48799.1 DNA-binding NarL/FixJ family response regulator [Hymenobacter chitinivorans DSM 11115]